VIARLAPDFSRPGARPGGPPLRILLLGAHADDIEIGCGGAVLRLVAEHPGAEVRYVVFAASPTRADESRAAATELAAGARLTVDIHGFRDSFLPWDQPVRLKETLADLRRSFEPDLIFTHHRADLHQDHALIAQLTWTTFRDHLILEYEIPKYEGDLGHPNVYIPLDEAVARRKIDLILRHYATQAGKGWFRAETFEAVLRLRGIECNAPSGWAEAFHGRKILL
jgi:LmbE family N-acetylglucosaminyl deacetylase